MKKISYVWLLFAVLLFTNASCTQDSISSTENDGLSLLSKAGTNFIGPNTFDKNGNLCINLNSPDDQVGKPMQLWMGVGNEKAGTLVGTVTFLHKPDKVRIDLTDTDGDGTPDMFPYVVEVAHIHFAGSEGEIPQTKKGNPIPGQFEYNVPVEPFKSIIEIPVEFDSVGAIHLAVQKLAGVEGFSFYLTNEEVTLRVTEFPAKDGSGASYFKFKIDGGGFISDYDMGNGEGIYEGWCIDVDKQIALNKDYPALLFSSYEELPEWLIGYGKIEYPENFDLVNYLINKYVVGQLVQPLTVNCEPVGELESLNFSDIQRAIWSLIDDDQSLDGIRAWSQERVNAILCDARSNGEGFEPGCDDKIVFLVVPTDKNLPYQMVIGQPTISSIQVPCNTSSGTAWGDGYFGATFPGSKQWGTWFEYDPTCIATE